ncbi:MAG TPA: phosphatase PAP2 family protein [Puia sp.]|nr:phosphatase PAP2 family protein [Puia sp.]
MSLLQWLDHLDKTLFVLVQHDSDHSVLDVIMPFLREPLTWIPLYAFMLYYAFRVGRQNIKVSGGQAGNMSKTLAFIILTVLTVAITDSVTARLLKPLFGRLRPCHDPEIQPFLRSLVDCGGLYSMPSNHAANHFGLAAFWYFSIRALNGQKWRWLWFWAGIICYAQVYVGKHYPFDILVGCIFGTLTGLGMSRLFVYWQYRLGHRFHLTRHPLKNSTRISKI